MITVQVWDKSLAHISVTSKLCVSLILVSKRELAFHSYQSQLDCFDADILYVGLPMYKSILMNLKVFPIFISSPANLILKIPKIASKNIFSALLWSKIVN